MLLEIHTIINTPIPSNCYIVSDSLKNCVIIDPGSESNDVLMHTLNKNSFTPQYIILTHEHFDHIWGVNELRSDYPGLKLVCSESCSERIQHKKHNFSLFYNGIGFETSKADITISKFVADLKWNDTIISLIPTPGHSEGSICIYIGSENVLFTGDTIIYKEKTVTKLKGGNIQKLNESLQMLDRLFLEKNPLLLPGHGKSVYYDKYIKALIKCKKM